LPILTNTWAYPPAVLGQLVDVNAGHRPAGPVFSNHDVAVVVLRLTAATGPLARALQGDPDWALVHLDAWHGVWLRRTGPNAALARRAELDLTSPAASERLIATAGGQDPTGAHGRYLAGVSAYRLGAYGLAAEALRASLAIEPDWPDRWNTLGLALVSRGTERLAGGDPRGRADLQAGRSAFQRALSLESDHEQARQNLRHVERQLADLRRGVLWGAGGRPGR
jgi:tetratricopeptide (TPR) repeat protein